MDEEDNYYNSNDNYYNNNYGGRNYKSPFFSYDITNIKNRIDKAKAEQLARKTHSLDENNDNNDSNDNKKELPKKDNFDKNDNLDKKEKNKDGGKDNKEKDSLDKKDNKKSKGLFSKKEDNNSLIEEKKGKFSFAKIKLMLIAICVFIGSIFFMAIAVTVASVLGLFDGKDVDIKTVNPDDYDITLDRDYDELKKEINDSFVKQEDNTSDNVTDETIEDQIEESNTDNSEEESNETSDNSNNNEIEKFTK